MKLIAPDYYTAFKCIAERCRHNCCKGWEIDIDEDTYKLYGEVSGEFGARLREGIVHAPHPTFNLDEDERCAFLNQNGLCDIICELGEEALCDICADHPRFRNFFTDRIEIGLGLCCEEVCRIILENSGKVTFALLEGGEGAPDKDESEFFTQRSRIFDILQNRNEPLGKRLARLCVEYNINLAFDSTKSVVRLYRELERMDSEWDRYLDILERCEHFTDDAGFDTCFEQLAVYFVYRHLAESVYDDDLTSRLAFCVLSVRIIQTICAAVNADIDTIKGICRLYSCEIEYSDENIDEILEKLK